MLYRITVLLIICFCCPHAMAETSGELDLREDITRTANGTLILQTADADVVLRRDIRKGAHIEIFSETGDHLELQIPLLLSLALFRQNGVEDYIPPSMSMQLTPSIALKAGYRVEIQSAYGNVLIHRTGDAVIPTTTGSLYIFAGGTNTLAPLSTAMPQRVYNHVVKSVSSGGSSKPSVLTNFEIKNSYLTEYAAGELLPYNDPALWGDSEGLQDEYSEFCFTDPCCCSDENEPSDDSGSTSDSSDSDDETIYCDAEQSPKRLLLMVHGYGDDGFRYWGPELRSSKCHFPVMIKWSAEECLNDVAKKVVTAVKTMCDVCPWCEIDIVGHSSGGVAAAVAAVGYKKEQSSAPKKTIADVCADKNFNVTTIAAPLNAGNAGFAGGISGTISYPTRWANKCFLADLMAGIPKFGTPSSRVKVTHVFAGKSEGAFGPFTEDGVVPSHWGEGNEVPGATSKMYDEATHESIVNKWAEDYIEDCNCTERDKNDTGDNDTTEEPTSELELMMQLSRG